MHTLKNFKKSVLPLFYLFSTRESGERDEWHDEEGEGEQESRESEGGEG